MTLPSPLPPIDPKSLMTGWIVVIKEVGFPIVVASFFLFVLNNKLEMLLLQMDRQNAILIQLLERVR